ncbi:MAG TPA: hypothetical protein VHY79_14930 [Rhizomicrobium sp.]|jgi:hypothetical protein|nr:hypothetical protein [Rhizomicrobium sp.]
MGKYEALGQFLKGQPTNEVPLSFSEIERVIGSTLPHSAYAHRPWWSNNPSNSAMTRVWLEAGFRTERVDMAAKKLVFKRLRGSPEPDSSPVVAPATNNGDKHEDSPEREKKPRRHPLFGALKGTFTIDPDWDLTQPAMPEWADLIDEKYGPEKRK